MKPTLVILAAGMGSRYGGIKQIEKVGPHGESLIDYSIYNALKAGFKKIVFVIRKDIETQIRDFFAKKLPTDIEIHYAHQELSDIPSEFSVPKGRKKPWGTGQALLVCKDALGEDPFVMINGDDYYAYASLVAAIEFLNNADISKSHYAVIGYCLKETLSDFGSVSRGICKTNNEGNLTYLEEHTKISKTALGIKSDFNGTIVTLTGNEPVSMNLFAFTPSFIQHLKSGFHDFLKTVTTEEENLKAEFFVPAYLGELVRDGKSSAQLLTTNAEWFGITYKEDTARVKQRLIELTNKGSYPTPLF